MRDRGRIDWSGADGSALAPEAEVARRWARSVRTLQRWRSEGYGPAYMRIGGGIVYRVEDVLAFEGQMRITPGGRR